MFYKKRIEELEIRVALLEDRVDDLAHKMNKQAEEIDSLFKLYCKKEAEKQSPKAQRKPRPKRHNKEIIDGKENTKATK